MVRRLKARDEHALRELYDALAPWVLGLAYRILHDEDEAEDQPMVMGLPLPRTGERVTGAAMSIEPRGGSASPSGPMVFRLDL